MRPPRFDGTSDVDLFIEQFEEVRVLSEWDDRVALVQLRHSLEKEARDCGRADSRNGVYQRLRHQYGLTPYEARSILHNLKRDAGESYVSLWNRVEKL